MGVRRSGERLVARWLLATRHWEARRGATANIGAWRQSRVVVPSGLRAPFTLAALLTELESHRAFNAAEATSAAALRGNPTRPAVSPDGPASDPSLGAWFQHQDLRFNSDLYFSETDAAATMGGDRPSYEGLLDLVTSVRRGAVDHKLFGWESQHNLWLYGELVRIMRCSGRRAVRVARDARDA